MIDINEVIKRPEYEFLKTNPHLGKNIMFLTLGGSHAYGTNTDTSDIDIRGVFVNSRKELLGLGNCEQVLDKDTDTTVYSFNKVVSLMMNCNPNIIEMFGAKADTYTCVSDLGRELLSKKELFLSKRAFNSFSGYANSQLRRMMNAICRNGFEQEEKEQNMLNSILFGMEGFMQKYTDFSGNISLSLGDSKKKDYEKEIMVDFETKGYPLRDLRGIMAEMMNVIDSYDKINHRNNKKDALHLNKHAMHLIRLYLMCIDLLKDGQIVTYREKDIDLLMDIRNGKYMLEDGTYNEEFFELVRHLENENKKALEVSCLPKNPDYDTINKLLVEINGKSLGVKFFD